MASQPTASSSTNEYSVEAITAGVQDMRAQSVLTDEAIVDTIHRTEVGDDLEIDLGLDKLAAEETAGDGTDDVIHVDHGHIEPLIQGDNRHEGLHTQLPEPLRFQESGWLYPDSSKDFHRQYRGQDFPSMNNMFSASKNARISDYDWAAVTVRAWNDPNLTEAVTVGVLGKKTSEDPAKDWRCIRQGWILHSQVPGFYLDVRNRGFDEHGVKRESVYVKIHANSISRFIDEDGICRYKFGIARSGEQEHEQWLDRNFFHESTYGSTGGLAELWFGLHHDDDAEFGPPVAQPMYEGLSAAEQQRILETGDAAADEAKWSNLEVLSTGDWVLYTLLRGTSFSIYRQYPVYKKAVDKFDKFRDLFGNQFIDALLNGNWPHYVRQAADVSIYSPKFKISQTCPPRWLIKKFRVLFVGGKPHSYRAEEWAPYMRLTTFPSPEDKAFALRVGIERGRGHDVFEQQSLIDVAANKIVVSFRLNPLTNTPTYYVQMRLGDQGSTIFGEGRNVRPREGTRVEIYPQDCSAEGMKFEGNICEDMYASGAELCAFVKGAERSSVVAADNNNGVYNCKAYLVLLDDPTACDRQNIAMTVLGSKTFREVGVDIGRLALRSPQVIRDNDAMAREVQNNKAASDLYQRVLHSQGLNGRQELLVRQAFSSRSGAVLLFGPPGTGKTVTVTTFSAGQVLVGRVPAMKRRPLLSCAPTNRGTHELARKMKSRFNLDDRTKPDYIEAVIVSAGVNRSKGFERTKAPNALADHQASVADSGMVVDDMTMTELHWDVLLKTKMKDFVSGDLAELLFAKKLTQWMNRVGRDVVHPKRAWIAEYAALRTELKDTSKMSGDDRKAKLTEMRDLEYALLGEYLSTVVDVVFCTNNSAATNMLMDHYQPRVVVLDEATFASFPDASTPLAAYKDSVELVVMCGDHMQQNPPPLSQKSNECWRELMLPLFNTIIQDRDKVEMVKLVEQYRMKPDFSRMVSDIWYGGELVDDPSLNSKSGLEVCFDEAYARLKPHWNGRRRVAVAIDSPEAFYESSASLYNRAEADLLIDHLEYLLKFTPVSGSKILSGDCMVITPYGGQQTYIKKQLSLRGAKSPALNMLAVPVVRSFTSQSGEARVVLLSLVRNVPGKPLQIGFVKKSSQLCVEFSRVKDAMVTFGNWRNWAQAQVNAVPALNTDRSRHHVFAQVLASHRNSGDLVSAAQLMQLHSGQRINVADAVGHIVRQSAPGLGDRSQSSGFAPNLAKQLGKQREAGLLAQQSALAQQAPGDKRKKPE